MLIWQKRNLLLWCYLNPCPPMSPFPLYFGILECSSTSFYVFVPFVFCWDITSPNLSWLTYNISLTCYNFLELFITTWDYIHCLFVWLLTVSSQERKLWGQDISFSSSLYPQFATPGRSSMNICWMNESVVCKDLPILEIHLNFF